MDTINFSSSDASHLTTSPLTPQEEVSQSFEHKTYAHEEIEAMSCPQIVEIIAQMTQGEVLPPRKEVDMLTKAFDRKLKDLERSEEPDLAPQAEEAKVHEGRLKDILIAYRARYQQFQEEEQKRQEANLEHKKNLLTSLKDIIAANQDDFQALHTQYVALEAEWKSVGAIPEANTKEIQDEYYKLREEYYDLRHINDEIRAYDFRKNLQYKEGIIAQAEALQSCKDPVLASKELQQLHREWKEIGPVEKSLREELWSKFNAISHEINKQCQAYFDNRNAQEEENLEKKKALCETLEKMPIDSYKQPNAWRKATEEVLALQKQWKEVGSAPRSQNNAIYERFRAACDYFFHTKETFFKGLSEAYAQSEEKKRKLIAQAEALADSTDWNKTAKQLIALQEEWRKAGHSSKRTSDELWNQFRVACDKFFNARKEQFRARDQEQAANLKAKREVIVAIEALIQEEGTPKEEIRTQLATLVERYNEIGHVPYRDKEKVYRAYRKALDDVYAKFQMERNQRRLEAFTSNVEGMEGDLRKMKDELEKLLYARDRMAKELQTASGNMDLFTSSSKWGNSVLKDIEQKQERLKKDLITIQEKIRILREAMQQEKDKE